ncbi:ANKRD50 [Symbiodinium natans]|uniref:ANKRD50 protein n=1 Tax=Symbiodinium natans TaxID=878477 RepID=A0A812HVM1_9DINO|nr:ANKRD50 [Symbiodinium natans]
MALAASCRQRAASLGLRRQQVPHFLECSQLLQARDAEIRHLRCRLEELHQEHLSGTGEHLAEVFRSQQRSRSRLEDLADKQLQQLRVAEEAAGVAEQRRIAAVEVRDQAKAHLGQLTTRARGMGQQSKELHMLMELECMREADASDALGTSQEQGAEALQEIGLLEKRVEKAEMQEALLEGLICRQEPGIEARMMADQSECSTTRYQELAAEHQVLEEKLQRRRSRLQQVHQEQEAAIPNLEQELQILEVAIQRAGPEEMHTAWEEKCAEKQVWQQKVSEMESEFRAAHRQRAEHQRKLTLALANCRREIESKEAVAKWSSAQSLKPIESAHQEVLQRYNQMQVQVRQHKAKRRVGNAFKAPLLRQRAGKPQLEAPATSDEHHVAVMLRRRSRLRAEEAQQQKEAERWREREQRIVSELQEFKQIVDKLRGQETTVATQMTHWRDCVESLRREQSWLEEECHSAEAENEAQESSQLQAIRQLQQELASAESS